MITDVQANELREALEVKFPGKKVRIASARDEAGLDGWFADLDVADTSTGRTMDVDYKVYAEGEALLGWLNATVELSSDSLIDGDALLKDLAEKVQIRLSAADIEIAHFKMTLSPSDNSGELAVVSLVGNAWRPEFSQELSDPLDRGQIIVNLRAEGDPETLHDVLVACIEDAANASVRLDLDHIERFRPAEPKPIYRMSDDREPAVALN